MNKIINPVLYQKPRFFASLFAQSLSYGRDSILRERESIDSIGKFVTKDLSLVAMMTRYTMYNFSILNLNPTTDKYLVRYHDINIKRQCDSSKLTSHNNTRRITIVQIFIHVHVS